MSIHYNNIDENERPKLNIPKSNLEKILGCITILAVLFTWIYLFNSWAKMPSKIPTHFDFSGRVDSWGGKGSLLVLPVVTSLLYLALTLSLKFPHHYNYIISITKENAKREYHNARTLIVWLRAEVIAIFSYLEWQSIQVAMNKAAGLGLWFLPVFLVIVFGTLGIYIRKMLKLK